jgi:hypothetical protein
MDRYTRAKTGQGSQFGITAKATRTAWLLATVPPPQISPGLKFVGFGYSRLTYVLYTARRGKCRELMNYAARRLTFQLRLQKFTWQTNQR